MLGDSGETSCLIVGGGPAGMMLGLLLARRGIDVTLMEKHADFLRDFRGVRCTRAPCAYLTNSAWDRGSPRYHVG